MNKIVSNEEIALIAGVSGTAAKMNFSQKIALELLQEALGVKSFGVHTVTLEKYRITDPNYLRLRDFPVDASSVRVYRYPNAETEVTGYTFTLDDRDEKKVWISQNGLRGVIIDCDIFVSYTAGYILQGEIEVAVNPTATNTLTVENAGVETTYTFVASGATGNQINIGGTAALTAINIKTALGGTVVDDVVTMPLGMSAEASNETSLVIENPNIPSDLKAAVAYITAGTMNDTAESNSITSYSIGAKSVNFRTDKERNFIVSTIDKYTVKYNDSLILS